MLQLAWIIFPVVRGEPVAAPRHGKYPFVLVVMAQTSPLCCSSSPGVQGTEMPGMKLPGRELGGPAALPQSPSVLALPPRGFGEHQVRPVLSVLRGWVSCW